MAGPAAGRRITSTSPSATPVDADPQVWGEIAERSPASTRTIAGDAARQAKFRTFAIARLAPVLARIGWDAQAGEADPVAILRSELIGTLGAARRPGGDRRSASPLRRRRRPIRPRCPRAAQARSSASSRAMPTPRRGSSCTPRPRPRRRRWSRTSSTRCWRSREDEALAQRALELALTDEPGATNSAAMIADGRRGSIPDLAFDFAMAHRERMNSLLAPETRNRYYPRLGSGSHDAAMIDKIRRFAEANVPASSRRGAESAMAKVGYGATIANERLGAVDAWLASRRP